MSILIYHPPRKRFLMQREEFFELLEDSSEASVLSILEYFMQGEVTRLERTSGETIESSPWFSASVKAMAKHSFGVIGEKTARLKIDALERRGYLEVKTEPGGLSHYRINVSALNCELESRFPVQSRSGKTTAPKSESEKNYRTGLEREPHMCGKTATPYKEEEVKELQEKRVEEERPLSSLASPNSKDEDVSLPEQSLLVGVKTSSVPRGEHVENDSLVYGLDLQLDEPVLRFVENAYRQCSRRAKLEKLNTRGAEGLCRQIESTERQWSPVEFRAALWCFLSTADDWLEKNKYPVRSFLKHVHEYFKPEPTNIPVPRKPAPVSMPGPKNIACELVHTWDTINPSLAVGEVTPKLQGKIIEALQNPEFAKGFPKICETVSKLQGAGRMSNLSLPWLFFMSKGEKNWYLVLYGQFDHFWQAERQGFSKPLSAADQLRKEIAAKKAS